MSRNCGETLCACGLWDFRTTEDRVAPDDLTLKTQAEVWGAWPDVPLGYGFRDDLCGNYYHGVRRDAAGRSVGSCSGDGPYPPGYTRELAWTYAVPNTPDRYRWRRVDCPLCGQAYAGWYVQQPSSLDPPCYELYDLSYWHALNDEPCEADRALADPLAPAELIAAVRAYRNR